MNDTKEKSAVGAATPATEMNNNTSTSIISRNEEKIKIVLQIPGEISQADWLTGHMNDLLGGHTTVVTISENGLNLVFSTHSSRRGKPNLKTLWGRIYGTVVVTKMEGRDFISLTPEQIQSARGWLLRHIYEEESYEN